MKDAALFGREALHRNAPALRGRGEQHLPARRADLAHGQPVHRRGEAAAGKLEAVLLRAEIGLLDADQIPVRVQLIRDQHGQHRLDALADLRVLADDGNGVVRRDGDEGAERRFPGGGRARHRSARDHRHGGGQREAAAGKRADLEQRAAGERGGGAIGDELRHWPCLHWRRPARWRRGCGYSRRSGRYSRSSPRRFGGHRAWGSG